MAEQAWEPIQEPTPKLQQFGRKLSPRFMDPTKSSLHSAQRQALQKLVDWFADKKKKNFPAVVIMPAGTGKSGVICCLPYTIGGAVSDIDMGKPILIIAPGIDLVYQLENDLHNFFEERGLILKSEARLKYSITVVHCCTNIESIPKKSDDIVLINSTNRGLAEGTPTYADLPSDLFSMVIVDEAHHLPLKQWDDIVAKFGGWAKIVVMTATPLGMPKYAETAFKNIIPAYELTRKAAVDQGLIRDVRMQILKYSETISDTSHVMNDHHEGMEYVKEVMFKVLDRVQLKNEMTPLPGNLKHAAVVITKDTREAEKVKEMCIDVLKLEKERVKVIHSALKSKRKEELERIQGGCYEVVIIVEILLETFDYPPFSVAGIVTKLSSPVKFAQFVGRIQRLVRYRNEDGTIEVEEGVKGDVITHEFFEQERLFQDYVNTHPAASRSPSPQPKRSPLSREPSPKQPSVNQVSSQKPASKQLPSQQPAPKQPASKQTSSQQLASQRTAPQSVMKQLSKPTVNGGENRSVARTDSGHEQREVARKDSSSQKAGPKLAKNNSEQKVTKKEIIIFPGVSKNKSEQEVEVSVKEVSARKDSRQELRTKDSGHRVGRKDSQLRENEAKKPTSAPPAMNRGQVGALARKDSGLSQDKSKASNPDASQASYTPAVKKPFRGAMSSNEKSRETAVTKVYDTGAGKKVNVFEVYSKPPDEDYDDEYTTDKDYVSDRDDDDDEEEEDADEHSVYNIAEEGSNNDTM